MARLTTIRSVYILYWCIVLLYLPIFSLGVSQWTVKWPVDESFVTRYAHSKFRKHGDLTDLSAIFQNKRIMFIGDSLTRYQYLNLIRYLHSGRWSDPLAAKLCCENSSRDWDDFFARVSSYFGCHHICDCRRWPEKIGPGSQENHYYYDPDLNLTISSHLWFGVMPMLQSTYRYMPSAEEFKANCQNFTVNSFTSDGRMATSILPPRYSYSNITSFLVDMVKPSRVDVLIVNFGHWENKHNDVFKTEAKVTRFCQVATSIVPLVIWKTTTARQHYWQIDDERFFSYLDRYPMIKVFDAYNLTVDVAYPVSMFDQLHYLSFVYRELNIALLEHLEQWMVTSKQ